MQCATVHRQALVIDLFFGYLTTLFQLSRTGVASLLSVWYELLPNVIHQCGVVPDELMLPAVNLNTNGLSVVNFAQLSNFRLVHGCFQSNTVSIALICRAVPRPALMIYEYLFVENSCSPEYLNPSMTTLLTLILSMHNNNLATTSVHLKLRVRRCNSFCFCSIVQHRHSFVRRLNVIFLKFSNLPLHFI